MKLFPAIDIKDGKCVRLRRGVAADKTVYYENPLDAAKWFADCGAECVHVVDLDGAFEGAGRNLDIVEKIASSSAMFVELGGGMRTRQAVERAFSVGVQRAIIGTKACTNPEFALSLAADFGEKIAVGLDAKNGMVAIKGWVEVGDKSAFDLGATLASGGVKTFVFTDIDTDGMLAGINAPSQEKMLSTLAPFGAKLVASGGVATLADIETLLLLAKKYPNLEGAITGKAVYEKTLDLGEAVALTLK